MQSGTSLRASLQSASPFHPRTSSVPKPTFATALLSGQYYSDLSSSSTSQAAHSATSTLITDTALSTPQIPVPSLSPTYSSVTLDLPQVSTPANSNLSVSSTPFWLPPAGLPHLQAVHYPYTQPYLQSFGPTNLQSPVLATAGAAPHQASAFPLPSPAHFSYSLPHPTHFSHSLPPDASSEYMGSTPSHSHNSNRLCSPSQLSASPLLVHATASPTLPAPNLPIHAIVFDRNLPALEHVLRTNPWSEAQDSYGCTAVHVAADQGWPDGLETLLKFGFSPHVPDYQLCTPLHYAARRGVGRSVSLLLQHRADPKACDVYGARPLNYAPPQSEARELLAMWE